jgi:hypothetical protein
MEYHLLAEGPGWSWCRGFKTKKQVFAHQMAVQITFEGGYVAGAAT